MNKKQGIAIGVVLAVALVIILIIFVVSKMGKPTNSQVAQNSKNTENATNTQNTETTETTESDAENIADSTTEANTQEDNMQETTATEKTEAPEEGVPYEPETFVYEGLDQEFLATLDPTKKAVAFTFDDGPVGTAEDAASMVIQKALKEHGAHATFFYIGGNVNADGRKEIQMAYENGFEVGNHSWGWQSVSDKEKEIKNSIEKTNAVLTDITGYSNFLFRAPNLAINKSMQDYIKAPFINCALDSKDWMGLSAEEIYANLTNPIAEGKNLDGAVILMHEFNTETYKNINELIEYYQNAGYQVVSVSELFALKGKDLTTGKIYNSAN